MRGAVAQRRSSSIVEISESLKAEGMDLGGHSSPDGAVTIYFSDIEGSAVLTERLGDHAWMAVLKDHNAKMRELAASHDGDVVKSLGDGFMFAFKSAHSGLRCAIEAQRAFTGRMLPSIGEPLRVRIGLHSGFVIRDAEDFYGRNVVLASRIADDAQGGDILVSTAVKEYVKNDPSFAFEHHGEHHFKGVMGEHTIYAVSWEGGGGAPPGDS